MADQDAYLLIQGVMTPDERKTFLARSRKQGDRMKIKPEGNHPPCTPKLLSPAAGEHLGATQLAPLGEIEQLRVGDAAPEEEREP